MPVVNTSAKYNRYKRFWGGKGVWFVLWVNASDVKAKKKKAEKYAGVLKCVKRRVAVETGVFSGLKKKNSLLVVRVNPKEGNAQI